MKLSRGDSEKLRKYEVRAEVKVYYLTRIMILQNPYFHIFKPLIARACEMPWLSIEDIKEHMEKICVNRLISGSIDWQPILQTINYRGERRR